MRQFKISQRITPRESKSINLYLTEISKIELISSEDEITLSRKIQEGDNDALNKLVSANLRFVVSVAKQYQNKGLSFTDLINEGNLGLIKAAKKFDPSRGFKFISYAVWWIRQSILKSLRENARMVRLPMNKMEIYKDIQELKLNYLQEFEREPTIEEMSEILNQSVETITDLISNHQRHDSLDAPVYSDDDNICTMDLIHADESTQPDVKCHYDSLKIDLNRSLSNLRCKEREILISHFGLNGGRAYSIDELSREFELSKERIRQIRNKAINTLKCTSNYQKLNTYIG